MTPSRAIPRLVSRPERGHVNAGSLHWWHVVALLGALQGVVLAGALLSKRAGRTPRGLLAAAVMAFALFLASLAYYTPASVAALPHLFALSHPLPFLFGPLIYLYALSASERTRKLTRQDLWHGVPFVVATLSLLPILALSGPGKIALFERILAGEVPYQVRIAAPFKLLSGLAYTVATLTFLRRHDRLMEENYSTLERINLHWLQALALAAGGIWLLATGIDFAERLGTTLPLDSDALVAVAMTLLIYGIGYRGLRQPEIFRFATAEHRVVHVGGPSAPESAEDGAPTARYERSGLHPREAEALREQLPALMEAQQLHRSPDLTLVDLADALGVTPHKLSEVLNTQLGLSFHDFVNGYRVRELQERLRGPDGARLTYLALALSVGFASKSTFNAVFKKLTGQTPSEFRASVPS